MIILTNIIYFYNLIECANITGSMLNLFYLTLLLKYIRFLRYVINGKLFKYLKKTWLKLQYNPTKYHAQLWPIFIILKNKKWQPL